MRIYRRKRRWWFEWHDHRRREHRWSGLSDRRLTEVYAGRLLRVVDHAAARSPLPRDLAEWLTSLPKVRRQRLAALGITDAGGLGPVAEHIEAFRLDLIALGRSPDHVAPTVHHVKTIVDDLAVVQLDRLEADDVDGWLRRKRDGGMSPSTANHYLTAVQTFLNWCVRTRRLPANPLIGLRRLATQGALVRERRALTGKEVVRLLKVARSGSPWRDFTGEERYWLYRFALETGLRRGEMARLRVGDFDWSKSTVTVHAAYARKARTTRLIPLVRQTVRDLKTLWRRRNAAESAFRVPSRSSQMLRYDLAAAQIEFSNWRGRVDFHALRHTAATVAGERADSFRALMDFLGHTTPQMTQRYAHERLTAVRRIVDSMPSNVSPSVSPRKGRNG